MSEGIAPSAPGMPDLLDDTAPSGISSGTLTTDNITKDTTPAFRWAVATDASGIQGYWAAVDDSTPESGGTWIGKPLLGWGSTVDWTPTVTANGAHTIYVKAVDDSPGHNIGPASSLGFTIDTSNPSVPNMVAPLDGAITSDTTPTLDWDPATDGTSGTYRYRVQVDTWLGSSTGWLLPSRDVWVNEPTTAWDVTGALPEGTWYWRIMA